MANKSDTEGSRSTLDTSDSEQGRDSFHVGSVASAVTRGARRGFRQAWDHVWGPSGSVILHLLILFVLIRVVTFESRDASREIEIMVVETESLDLEDIQRELEQLPDIDVDIAPPELDITMDAPPDVQRPDPRPQDDIAALDIRTDVQSSLIMRGLFAGRTAAGRSAMLRRHGGRHAEATAASAYRALEWLRDRQLPDGSWTAVHLDAQGTWRPGRLLEDGTWGTEGTYASAKTGWTGLALLTFLAHGETTNSEVFGPTVERGLRFLIETAQNENGSFKHTEGGSRGGVYSHGIAAYALSEAYALTRIPTVKTAMERSVQYIINGMRPDGGFNYDFRREPGGHRDRCTSVAAWQAQALKAAYISGANIPGLAAALVRAAEGFKLNVDRASGRFMYASGGTYDTPPISLPQTAPGVLSLQLLGESKSPEVQQGIQTMSDWRPTWNEGWAEALYIWYYATQVYFHAGGSVWNRWNDAFSAMLVRNQNPDGSWTWKGDGRSAAYGPVYATTFSALSLMVYYRYLPTYQEIAIEPMPTQESEDDVKIEIL